MFNLLRAQLQIFRVHYLHERNLGIHWSSRVSEHIMNKMSAQGRCEELATYLRWRESGFFDFQQKADCTGLDHNGIEIAVFGVIALLVGAEEREVVTPTALWS